MRNENRCSKLNLYSEYRSPEAIQDHAGEQRCLIQDAISYDWDKSRECSEESDEDGRELQNPWFGSC